MEKSTKIIWGIAITTIVVALVIKGKKIKNYVQKAVWDVVSQARIRTLHPDIREKASAFINDAEKQGIFLRVVSAHRSYSEQNALYAQGRTAQGNIVTNAKAGQSSHNFGTGLDVVEMVEGTPKWESKNWGKIAHIGKSHGFSWGGDWNKPDRPHFYMQFGNSMAQLRSKVANGIVKDGYPVLT